jgi:2-polyprenyl-6-methoxyphenol hydroxylase-like FAD-dependent oxidoreductase
VSQPMKVAVAGGSLAGLMTGIEIRFAGAEVEIHERSAGILDDRGAGIVMQPETLQMLTQRCGLAEEESGVWFNYRQYLQPGGEPATRQRIPQLVTSWGLLYRALRSAFPAEHYYEGSSLMEFSWWKVRPAAIRSARRCRWRSFIRSSANAPRGEGR